MGETSVNKHNIIFIIMHTFSFTFMKPDVKALEPTGLCLNFTKYFLVLPKVLQLLDHAMSGEKSVITVLHSLMKNT